MDLWDRVGELADRAPRLSDLRHHKLQLIAADRMHRRGEAVPAELHTERLLQASMRLAAPALLSRIRGLYDGRILLMKGPEVAARWREPGLRPSKDLDVLVDDAEALQAALLANGFAEIGDRSLYVDIHHLRPLVLPGLPLTIEVHSRVKWPAQGMAPSLAELAEAARPCALGIDGVLAPSPEHHTVLLAAHAWDHKPLNTIGSLMDFHVMLAEGAPDAAAAAARAWGLERIWRATARAAEELLADEAFPPLWRRHLHAARERTVFEEHVARLVAPAAAVPASASASAVAGALAKTTRPGPDERWRGKMRRSLRALRHASAPKSEHDASLTLTPRRTQ